MSQPGYIHYIQSKNYAEYISRLGWDVFLLDKKWHIYRKKINPLGRSIVKIPRAPFDIDYQKVETIIEKEKPLFIKIEPDEILKDNNSQYLEQKGYLPDNEPICQSITILIDLQKSEDILLKSLRSETRHHLRKSWSKELVVDIIESNEKTEAKEAFNSFYTLFEHCAKERNFYAPFKTQMNHMWESFSENAYIFLVHTKESKQPLSGALVLTNDNVAYYKHGASLPEGRNIYASYFLFWEMFMWAKKNNLKLFDLEGIYDYRYKRTKQYKGFTQFKRGWSKNEKTYIGSFTKYYSLPLKILSRITS